MLRRTRIINRKFQLHTAFSIIGIILIGFILIIAVTGIIEFDRNRRITGITASMQAALVKHREDAGKDSGKVLTASLPADSLRAQIVEIEKIAGQNRLLFLVIISMAIILSAVLYFHIITLTQRVSGPIYVLSRHIDTIMEGGEPDFRALRKDDEFKEFYAQFETMTRRLRAGKENARS